MLSLAEAVESGALGLFLSLTGTYLYSRRKGAEALDAERRSQVGEAIDQVRQHADTIESQNQRIAVLSSDLTEAKRPKRTAAEEHHFAIAKDAITRIGPAGVEVLRHLYRVGQMRFGIMDPGLPMGISRDATLNVLISCQHLGLVTREESRQGLNTSYIYKIAPGMEKALDELLFSD